MLRMAWTPLATTYALKYVAQIRNAADLDATPNSVVPAKAGTQRLQLFAFKPKTLDPRFRGDDDR